MTADMIICDWCDSEPWSFNVMITYYQLHIYFLSGMYTLSFDGIFWSFSVRFKS